MPSTVLVLSLLLIYTIITGRFIGALNNLQALIKVGFFSPNKMASKTGDIKPKETPKNEGDLPDTGDVVT